MASKRIFTVGRELPGDGIEYVPFDSDQSLLDADIVLFSPQFGPWHPGNGFGELASHAGIPVMSPSSSAEMPPRLKHWRDELAAAAKVGALVVIFLEKPEIVYRDTGARNYSGTGRNTRTTTIVEEISTYSSVPVDMTVTARSGTKVEVTPAGSLIANYWRDLGAVSPYAATMEGKYGAVMLRTPGVNRVVASLIRMENGGGMLFLPPPSFPREKFVRFDKNAPNFVRWNAEGSKFGNQFVAHIVGIAKTLAADVVETPPPAWTATDAYLTHAEKKIQGKIEGTKRQIKALAEKQRSLLVELGEASQFRHLLYEQGRRLEATILRVLRLIGFEADGYAKDGSEFDVIFSSPEGRCLGEAEGKDTKAINVDKFSQLERNLNEDYEREEVTERAKGVLFGNAYRLSPVAERGDFFTEKCLRSAMRAKIALVRTPDLFPVARYLSENRDDEFATACRQAIYAADGQIVVFPAVPEEFREAVAPLDPPPGSAAV